uniref:Uncharacterized protein n=1 Tax=Leersia perrieri TaxID=77586 RepID=A0A0D9V1Q0_9ORYZ
MMMEFGDTCCRLKECFVIVLIFQYSSLQAHKSLRRVALAAAVAGTVAVALSEAEQWGISGRISHRGPHPDADAAATRGHLGLIRAHPGLQDLNSALASSRDAFFLDAAHALAASALRVQTVTSKQISRLHGPGGLCKDIAAAESRGDESAVVDFRLLQALIDAREGRFDEALAAAVRLIRDSPGDPRPRLFAAALCFLHGRSGTALEWLRSVPDKSAHSALFFDTVLYAMPGSSPRFVEEGGDGTVVILMHLATTLAEAVLLLKLEQENGRCSVLGKLEIAVLSRLLRLFLSKHFTAAGGSKAFRFKMPRSSTPINPSKLNRTLVQCSQAILAPVLRARPLCGERLRVVRSIAERALLDAEAETGDASAAVDVNLLLAFLAARDGHFNEAMRRYAAAAKRDPSDPRPYELADKLCFVIGQPANAWRDAWQRAKEKPGRATRGHHGDGDVLQPLLDELVIAAALGNGGLADRDPNRGHVLVAAWREVDAGLAAALRDRDLTLPERVQLRGLRYILRAKIQPLLDNATQHEPENSNQH